MKHWLKYRSDREAFHFMIAFAFIAICSLVMASRFDGALRDLLVYMGGFAAASCGGAHAVKRMRRYWNDKFGRDIWYGDE